MTYFASYYYCHATCELEFDTLFHGMLENESRFGHLFTRILLPSKLPIGYRQKLFTFSIFFFFFHQGKNNSRPANTAHFLPQATGSMA
jgi:hypothetical protein